jgi:hypothetical protein
MRSSYFEVYVHTRVHGSEEPARYDRPGWDYDIGDHNGVLTVWDMADQTIDYGSTPWRRTKIAYGPTAWLRVEDVSAYVPDMTEEQKKKAMK